MKGIARDVLLIAAALGLLCGTSLAGDKTKPQKKKTEAAPQTVIIQIDASKLPADVLQQLLKAATADKPDKPSVKKPGDNKPGDNKPGDKKTKTLTLAEAIAVAEKHVQGVAIKAAYVDDGFAVALKTDKGMTEVKMDLSGNIGGDKGGKQQGGDEPKPGKKPGKKKN